MFHTAKTILFQRSLRGEDHLKRRSSSPRLPTLLGCAPHLEIGRSRGEPSRTTTHQPHHTAPTLSLVARGNSSRVFSRPTFYISTNPGRGAGEPHRAQLPEPRQAREGSGEGSSARERRPPQCAKAPRCCGATRIQPRSRGCAGEPPALRGRHERLRGSPPTSLHRRFQLKVQTNSKRNKSKFSAQQKQYSLAVFAEGETISNAEVFSLRHLPLPWLCAASGDREIVGEPPPRPTP